MSRRKENFQVGDMVYLKLQPYRQKSLAKRTFERLALRFYGPFAVVERIWEIAYKLDLPATRKIHPVFHVSQLKRAVGNALPTLALPIQLSSDSEMMVEPEIFLSIRKVGNGDMADVEVLFQWRNLPEYEATWESIDMVRDRFPNFHLEDKVILLGGE